MTYTLTPAELSSRLRCVASAADGPAGGATVASFISPEYAVAASPRCAPRRLAPGGDPQPAIVQVGDPGCLTAPSSLAALGTGFQGLAVKGGRAAIWLSCQTSGGCRGKLSLRAGAVPLGSAKVRVRRGSGRLVRLTLNGRGRRMIKGGDVAATLTLGVRRLADVTLET